MRKLKPESLSQLPRVSQLGPDLSEICQRHRSPAKPDSRLHLSLGWDSEPFSFFSWAEEPDSFPLPLLPPPIMSQGAWLWGGCGPPSCPLPCCFCQQRLQPFWSEVFFFFFFFLLIPLGETDVGGEGGEHTHTHLSPEVPQVPDSLLRCVGHWRPQLPPRHPPTYPTPLHCAPAFPLVDKPPSSPNSLLGKTSCLRPKFLVLDQLTAKQCG